MKKPHGSFQIFWRERERGNKKPRKEKQQEIFEKERVCACTRELASERKSEIEQEQERARARARERERESVITRKHLFAGQ